MPFRIVQTTYYFNNSLVGLINPTLAAPLLLAAAKLGLGKAAITPTPGTLITDLVPCDFVGYAESATVVWGAPVNEDDGSQTSLAPSHLFRATAATTPNQVNNFYVTDGVASPNQGILGAARINPAIPINVAGDGFSLTVGWNLGPASGNCEGTITS